MRRACRVARPASVGSASPSGWAAVSRNSRSRYRPAEPAEGGVVTAPAGATVRFGRTKGCRWRGRYWLLSRSKTSVLEDADRHLVAPLVERRSGLTAVQRIAVVDAAAWWLTDPAGGGTDLTWALLTAASTSEAVIHRAYLTLITPPAGPPATDAG